MDPVFKEALAMTEEAAKAQVDLLEAGSKVGAHTPEPWTPSTHHSVPQPAGHHVADWYEREQPCASDILHALAHVKGERDELAEALRASVEIIKLWHNMGMPEGDQETWRIYYEHSPEMQSIRETLAKLDTDSTKGSKR